MEWRFSEWESVWILLSACDFGIQAANLLPCLQPLLAKGSICNKSPMLAHTIHTTRRCVCWMSYLLVSCSSVSSYHHEGSDLESRWSPHDPGHLVGRPFQRVVEIKNQAVRPAVTLEVLVVSSWSRRLWMSSRGLNAADPAVRSSAKPNSATLLKYGQVTKYEGMTSISL